MNHHATTSESFQKIDQRINCLVDITNQQSVLAQNMNNQLKEDISLLNDITNHMDKTQNQINNATSAVQDVKATKTQWIAWIMIIILIVINIYVWCFLKKN